jgi:hypothetical protein
MQRSMSSVIMRQCSHSSTTDAVNSAGREGAAGDSLWKRGEFSLRAGRTPTTTASIAFSVSLNHSSLGWHAYQERGEAGPRDEAATTRNAPSGVFSTSSEML